MWMQRVKEAPAKQKLCLIYLANGMRCFRTAMRDPTNTAPEIVQQSKIRKKEEFVKAYDPIIVEATIAAYKGSSSDVQQKIRRVVEVWRQRNVFRPQIQDQIEAAIDDLDRSRSTRKPALGGSLFSSSSVPPELTTVAPLATTLQKADMNVKPAINTANQEYEKLTNPNNTIPSPPMHAAGLAALVKKLATAEGAVAESIKARRALISGLEALLETNRAKLSAEEAQFADLGTRKLAIESRKREVEEAILKGLSAADQHAISSAPLPVTAATGSATSSARDSAEPARPDIEELTPPPMESFTPVGSPGPHVPDDALPEPTAHPVEPVSIPAPSGTTALSTAPVTAISGTNSLPNMDILAQITHAAQAHAASTAAGANGTDSYQERSAKKRKMSRSIAEDDMAAFAGDGEIEGIDQSLGNLI
jgi:regulator of Ty1 transposition protein 103